MIRSAGLLDAGRIGAILSNFTDTTSWLPRINSRAEDIAFADELIKKNWVNVFERTTIEGFIARNDAEIHALYVRTEALGQGVGTALMDHAKSQSDTLELWTFQANFAAQRFYERHGFLEVIRTDGFGNDEKLPDIQFKWIRRAG